jgi:hypothetical protein
MKDWTTEEFKAEFGAEAYNKAVEMTAVSQGFGDLKGAEMFAAIARDLLQCGEAPAPRVGR